MKLSGSVALLVLAFATMPLQAEHGAVGERIENFSLPDALGAKHALADWPDKTAVVVVFVGAECPLANLYGPRLAELSEQYAGRGVQFVAINSNRQDTLQKIGHYAQIHKIAFPVLKDASHGVADLFGAERTPTAYVLDNERKVRYRGRIDDQFGVGYARSNATINYVTAALDEILAGKTVTTPTTEAVGCYIARAQRKTPTGDITYSKEISRIMQSRCLRCHREGQIAPFSLTSYDEVTAWSETMSEVMNNGRMPPWHANPKYGEFANDAHMPDAEKQMFRTWVENGMPEGTKSDLPPTADFSDEWQIGKPDVIYKMPKPYRVPAKGVVPYQYFYLDADLKEDVWIKSAEIRPGNRAVVHHIFVFFLPPGQTQPRAEDPLYNAVASFAPGMSPGVWPDTYAMRVPAGSRLVFQIHYTPNGTEQIDQSEVGLVFADAKKVTTRVQLAAAINLDFQIPPGAEVSVPAGYSFTQDMILYALTPHMHYRGKSFRFTAEYPDGTKEILLDVPHYDFNWQNAYVFKHEKRMPKGTVVMCAGVFDNSAENLMNPDATKQVGWGDQTWDEMMLGSLTVSLPESKAAGEYPKIAPVNDGKYNVTFRYKPGDKNDNVKKVYLAGTFNDWKPTGRLMTGPDKQGYYQTTLSLKAGYHEYKFVVNGDTWITDPENPEQNGPFTNSVIMVRPPAKSAGESQASPPTK